MAFSWVDTQPRYTQTDASDLVEEKFNTTPSFNSTIIPQKTQQSKRKKQSDTNSNSTFNKPTKKRPPTFTYDSDSGLDIGYSSLDLDTHIPSPTLKYIHETIGNFFETQHLATDSDSDYNSGSNKTGLD